MSHMQSTYDKRFAVAWSSKAPSGATVLLKTDCTVFRNIAENGGAPSGMTHDDAVDL